MTQSNLLKERRQALGLTPEQVAKAAATPRATYKRLEDTGAQVNLYWDNIILIAQVLGLTVEDVAGCIKQ